MLLISDLFDESLITDIRTAMPMISKKWIMLFIFLCFWFWLFMISKEGDICMLPTRLFKITSGRRSIRAESYDQPLLTTFIFFHRPVISRCFQFLRLGRAIEIAARCARIKPAVITFIRVHRTNLVRSGLPHPGQPRSIPVIDSVRGGNARHAGV